MSDFALQKKLCRSTGLSWRSWNLSWINWKCSNLNKFALKKAINLLEPVQIGARGQIRGSRLSSGRWRGHINEVLGNSTPKGMGSTERIWGFRINLFRDIRIYPGRRGGCSGERSRGGTAHRRLVGRGWRYRGAFTPSFPLDLFLPKG